MSEEVELDEVEEGDELILSYDSHQNTNEQRREVTVEEIKSEKIVFSDVNNRPNAYEVLIGNFLEGEVNSLNREGKTQSTRVGNLNTLEVKASGEP
jgi:hypothetical protein